MMERVVADAVRSGRSCRQSQVTAFTWRLYVITRPLIFSVADLGLETFEQLHRQISIIFDRLLVLRII